MTPTPITVARGDGIGPEIMEATLRILDAAGAHLDIEEIEIGEAVYERGHTSGIEPSAWGSLRRTKVFLKAPISTPQGKGYKSLNVTIRKTLGLYANVRPCVAYAPFVPTLHPQMDVVVVRENEEDLYAGIEHQQTADTVQCLKLISRPGCERIARYAFEYARRHDRRKVTCFAKANIMKQTDGLFQRVFEEVAAEYSDIESDQIIVDIGAARLADTPERFDVVLMSNLYGDIMSDIAAQVSGSVGLGGSANIGRHAAMFEAIHGSAPDIAGKGIANPSGLLLASVMMLVHIGQTEVAEKVHNAWLRAIEDGVATGDIAADPTHALGTQDFADQVIARLGLMPQTLPPMTYPRVSEPIDVQVTELRRPVKTMDGVDVFLDQPDITPDDLAAKIRRALPETPSLNLQSISSRGVKAWPDGAAETTHTDHWCCRFLGAEGGTCAQSQVLELLSALSRAGLDWVKTEGLYRFDGQVGYSLGQGE